MFAYVGGGYATLQEYMIFDEYVDLINPHLVIWQYCANDVINNSLELEQRSSINNNGLRRPYLTENHDVIDRIPKTLPLLRHLANEHSPFLYLIIYCLDRLAAPLSQTSLATWLSSETIEREIARQGLQHSEFQRAAHMTDEIMGMVRARRPDLPILAFSVDDEAPHFEAWQQISQQHGIAFIADIPLAHRAAEAQGAVIRAADKAHWNEVGHRLTADTLQLFGNWAHVVGGGQGIVRDAALGTWQGGAAPRRDGYAVEF